MTEYVRTAAPANDQLDTLVSVLDTVRAGHARTRPELGRRSGLGRTVITQRVQQLIDCGLLEEGALGPSSGGRAPRELRFRADAGHLLVAEIGATTLTVAVTDLAGTLLEQQETAADITRGPQHSLHQVEQMFTAAVTAQPAGAPPIWGIGVSVPGPVEFATGRPIAPPIMPGWDGYPVRERLADAFDVPVWVDNDVNLMALGELRSGLAQGECDVVYIKIGTGIGAGLISGGRLHRGAQGCAGDVGHVAVVDNTSIVCRCGKPGCLEALAGGAALAREATAAARAGRSPHLAELLNGRRHLDARDVSQAAQHGDRFSVELLTRSGQLVGAMLATLVNFYNPSLIIIGGGVAHSGDLLLAAIREAVYRRSLPLATRNLRIMHSPLSDRAGLIGASAMAVDELLSPQLLAQWIHHGSPVGRPQLADARKLGQT
jgi:glucokinase-like ROK family protein